MIEGSQSKVTQALTVNGVKGSLFNNDDFDIWMLAMVTVLVIGLGSLAAGAGIGGGGLFVPLFAFVLGVGAKAAVPLSKATYGPFDKIKTMIEKMIFRLMGEQKD